MTVRRGILLLTAALIVWAGVVLVTGGAVLEFRVGALVFARRDPAASPVGYRPAHETNLLAPTYSPGLPLMMAAFQVAANR